MTDTKDTIIIGAGLSGLVVAHTLKQQKEHQKLVIIEKSSRTGGVIRSFSENGYHAEIGPHGFLDNCRESRGLLAQTGLDQECIKAPLATFVRYVCLNSGLMMIPQSPLKILKAPLIPWKDKLMLLGELFKKPMTGEPTVAKWADHRFGKALLPYVDAVFTGTYAGDYNELKIDAVMPGVRALEKEYGSVIRGAIAKARAVKRKKKSGEKLVMPAMTSFPEGMQRLPEKLTSLLGDDELVLNSPALTIQKNEIGWLIETPGKNYAGKNLVLALPVNQSLNLLKSVDASMPVRQIPEGRIATIVFGFKGAALPPGFGFLIPEVEKRFTLGTLFSSNMFPNRAPEGHIVFETLVGGRRHPERLDYDDETLTKKSLGDIRDLLDLPGEPSYSRVLRPEAGIPQLGKGYTDLLAWRNSLVQHVPGLYVCGFGWEGIGLNDMIKTATSAALKIAAGVPQFQDQAEVKKVYF